MKFKVREGFVVHMIQRIELGDGKVQTQEINFYEGQVCDLDAEQAADHAHKLEPVDAKAAAFLESKVVTPPAPVMGAAPSIDVTALAAAMVQAMVLAQQQMAATPAAGAKA